jgi:hypothetical protein
MAAEEIRPSDLPEAGTGSEGDFRTDKRKIIG